MNGERTLSDSHCKAKTCENIVLTLMTVNTHHLVTNSIDMSGNLSLVGSQKLFEGGLTLDGSSTICQRVLIRHVECMKDLLHLRC